MKLITAIIKPFKLDDVREAMTKVGVKGMTAYEVRGYGQQKGQGEILGASDYQVTFLPKVKIEIAAKEKNVKKIVKALQEAANTGKIGDGKIFITNIERVVRIHTGEEGEKAI